MRAEGCRRPFSQPADWAHSQASACRCIVSPRGPSTASRVAQQRWERSQERAVQLPVHAALIDRPRSAAIQGTCIAGAILPSRVASPARRAGSPTLGASAGACGGGKGGIGDLCAACGKKCYEAEGTWVRGAWMHRECVRCASCDRKLGDGWEHFDGKLYW